jgi:UDP-glucose 4-epimerase
MILITGGGGFLGLNLARDLVDREHKVLLVRRHTFEVPSFLAQHVNKQVKISLGDLGHLPSLYRVLKDYPIDSIIHAAALHEGTGTLYQALKSNLDGTTELLEAARIFGVKRITFVSSVAVYFGTDSMAAMHEDNDIPVRSPGPSAYITATKKAGEQICLLYAEKHGLSIRIVRPPLVWGPMYNSGMQPQDVMVQNAVAGKPSDFSQLYGQKRAVFVYVRDCAKAISLVHLAPSLKHDIYNISDGDSHTFADFAEAVREVVPNAQIKLGITRSEADPDWPEMSIERIKEDVGFRPDYDIRRAVKAYVDWLGEGKYN